MTFARRRPTTRSAAVLATTAVAVATSLTVGAGVAAAGPGSAGAAAAGAAAGGGPGRCPDVELVFARGTGEAPGIGPLGERFAADLRADLPGRAVRTYAVDYTADFAQSGTGAGATDLSTRVAAVARRCTRTGFVLAGYSQGASVVDIALGVGSYLGTGTPVPDALAGRVKAVVTFGNPLGLTHRTIATAGSRYGPRSLDICAPGDPVCGGGTHLTAHGAYLVDGSVTRGARFAAAQVRHPAHLTPAASGAPAAARPTTPTAPGGRAATGDGKTSRGFSVWRYVLRVIHDW